jgi:hypothetical protein
MVASRLGWSRADAGFRCMLRGGCDDRFGDLPRGLRSGDRAAGGCCAPGHQELWDLHRMGKPDDYFRGVVRAIIFQELGISWQELTGPSSATGIRESLPSPSSTGRSLTAGSCGQLFERTCHNG